MEDFYNFLNHNLNRVESSLESNLYRVGISKYSFLDLNSPKDFSDIDQARFLYVRNLCLNEPVPFQVPLESAGISPEERALMFLSFNNFHDALSSLNINLNPKIIGVTATKRTGQEVIVDVLSVENTYSNDMLPFTCDHLKFEDFKVQPLNKKELLFIYIKMMEIYRTEENVDIRKFKLLGYFRRIFFESNDLYGMLKIAFLIVKAEITNEYSELEEMSKNCIEISEDIFSEPLIFKSDINIQIGYCLKENRDFSFAYLYFEPFPLFYEKIECLIAMRNSEKAAFEINNYIQIVKQEDTRKNRMILSDLYIKLAHIYQDPSYYDLSASFFNSHKPYMLKGMHYYRNKMYDQAVDALEKAIQISPNNEDVLFSYGCSLFESARISEALKIFRRLRSENPLNINIVKNLSLCYYKLQNIESTLETLRSVVLQDHASMKQYIYMSLRNEKIDNVKWALLHVNYDPIIKDVVNYLIQTDKCNREDIKNILLSNSHYVNTDLDQILN